MPEDYEIIEEVAHGSMGVVYKAHQKSLNRTVALKLIRSGELADDTEVARFHAEAETAAQLDHPGIVPVHTIGEFDGRHFLSMAFIEGGSLADELEAGPFDPRRAAEIVKAVAEAVQFAHDRGIIHRDLKPQNILLDETGRPRVSDFGLAKNVRAETDLTATGQILGTPAYMSPEQAQGAPAGRLADVYSLGATLYCLLTGQPPFQAATQIELLTNVIEQAPVAPRALRPSLPRDLETICLTCLQKEPRARYSSAGEVSRDLGHWLRGEPIEARRTSRLKKSWLWCLRRRKRIATVAAIIIGGIVVQWLRTSEDRPPAPEVRFADPALQRAALGITDVPFSTSLVRSGPLTSDDLLTITSLDLNSGTASARSASGRAQVTHNELDLSEIGRFPNLEKLTIRGRDLANLDALGELKKLRELYFVSNSAGFPPELEDLSFLTPLTNLRELHMWLGSLRSAPPSLEPLRHLKKLEELQIRAAWIYRSPLRLDSLSALTELRELWVQVHNVSDIAPLSSLSQLQVLSLISSGTVSDLEPLRSLTRLEGLALGDNQISNVEPLQNLRELRVLLLESNRIEDIEPLKNLRKLQWLSLGNNQISDISALKELIDMRAIHLRQNQIVDLTPLQGMTKLGEIDAWLTRRLWIQVWRRSEASKGYSRYGYEENTVGLADNQIADVGALATNPGLGAGDFVQLRNNPLNDASRDSHVPALADRGVAVLFSRRPYFNDSEGFGIMFNGRTLAGWEGDPTYWSVEDAKIVGVVTESSQSQNSWIVWRGGLVEDFELLLNYRVSTQGAGAVGYRLAVVEEDPFAVRGPTALIDGGNTSSGVCYEENGRRFLAAPGQMTSIKPQAMPQLISQHADPNELQGTINRGHWNQYRLLVRGNHAQHYINGRLMSEVHDYDEGNRRKSGLIGLGIDLGTPMRIEFEGIVFRYLDESPSGPSDRDSVVYRAGTLLERADAPSLAGLVEQSKRITASAHTEPINGMTELTLESCDLSVVRHDLVDMQLSGGSPTAPSAQTPFDLVLLSEDTTIRIPGAGDLLPEQSWAGKYRVKLKWDNGQGAYTVISLQPVSAEEEHDFPSSEQR